MSRETAKNIEIDGNVRCTKIYPVEGSKKTIDELQTIGITLTKNQAIHLATVLLAVAQKWESIDITGFRLKKRKSDDTYPLTITTKSDLKTE